MTGWMMRWIFREPLNNPAWARRLAPHDLRLFLQKRAPRRVVQRFPRLPAAAIAASILLASCASPPPPPGVLENLRADLAALEENTELTELAPQALADARSAVRRAGAEDLSEEERSQRVWLARKQLEIARAEAFTKRAQHNIDMVDQRRTQLLLRASRLEARQARQTAEQALLDSIATQEEMERARQQASRSEQERDEASQRAREARLEAEQARRLAEAQSAEVDLARREAELASAQAQSLQRRLEYMEYRQTDRGVVVTLGDVLFASGETELLPSAAQNLDDVIELLESEPDKQIRIEGHTDSTGSAELNLRLSEQRARAVRDALIERGIDADRLDAVGMGEDFPIATNQTEEGRARNRRVDVIVLSD